MEQLRIFYYRKKKNALNICKKKFHGHEHLKRTIHINVIDRDIYNTIFDVIIKRSTAQSRQADVQSCCSQHTGQMASHHRKLNYMLHIIIVRSDDINCHTPFQSYLMTKQTNYYYYYYYYSLFERGNSIS